VTSAGQVRRSRLPVGTAAAWTGICAAAFAVLDRLGRGTTFFFDEWDLVLDENRWRMLLEPHNGHLIVVNRIFYRVLLEVVGLDTYRVARWCGLVVHLLVATLLVVVIRRRAGTVAGIAAGTVVLVLGSGSENIFWPFQIGFMGSVAAGLAAWLAFDARSRRGDVVGAACVGLSLACSGVGLAVTAGVLVRLLLERSWRRSQLALGVPLVLYGLWTLTYGTGEASIGNARSMPSYVFDAASGAMAGIAGRPVELGRFFLGAGLVVFLLGLAGPVRRRAGMLAAVSVPLALWALATLARAQYAVPTSSRYVYIGVVFLLVACAEAAAGRRYTRDPLVAIAVVVVAGLSVWGNVQPLRDGAGFLRSWTRVTGPELRAIEWAAATVAPDYRPDTTRMPTLTAGPYLAAVAEHGSPAAPDDVVLGSSDDVRWAVDRVLREASAVQVVSTGDAAPCGAGARVVEIPITGERVQVGVVGGAELRMRRIAERYPEDPVSVLPAGVSEIVAPSVTAPGRWLVELRATTTGSVCSR
jgi:hypothetical protein